MDHYTLMCSKLEPLQIKASLNPGNWWYHPHYGNGLAIQYWPCLHCDYEVEKAFWFDGYGIKLLEDLQSPMIWRPTEGQLMGMISVYPYVVKNSPWKSSYPVVVTIWKGKKEEKKFFGNNCHTALIQALAWSKWGKEWNKEKGEWK